MDLDWSLSDEGRQSSLGTLLPSARSSQSIGVEAAKVGPPSDGAPPWADPNRLQSRCVHKLQAEGETRGKNRPSPYDGRGGVNTVLSCLPAVALICGALPFEGEPKRFSALSLEAQTLLKIQGTTTTNWLRSLARSVGRWATVGRGTTVGE